MQFLWCAVVLAALAATAESGRIICYYSSWAVYRQGPGHYNVEDIDPTLCTHILYAFAQLTYDGEMKAYDDYNDIGDEWHEGQFTKFRKMKEQHPNIKTMIAVGGWTHGPGNFQETVTHPEKRQRWVDTAVAFCKTHGFDGMDIDWEYQDSVGGTPEQLQGFNEILRMFRQRFDQEGLILSAATQVNFNLLEVNYDMRVLSETLDFINVMSYDLHGAWEKYTEHVSPLHALASEEGYDRNLNVEVILKKYIERGADPEKINIGMPLYGRGFTLADPNVNGMYAPATGPSQMGQFVPEAGIMAYAEICLNRWQEVWQPEQSVPYCINGNQWIGYDTPVSLAGKMQFVKTLGVKNYMVWSVETDDFRGDCGGQPYPLLRAINNANAQLSA